MVKLRATEYLSLRSTFVFCVILFLKIESSLEVGITVIESAVAKGAVCLDGTPPAYQLDRGFGDGVNNWLVHMQGGGWCHTIENCVVRKTLSYGFGSSELMPELNFTGLLSNQQDQNPNFYNWNIVYMRYCDGASFTGDVEEVDPVNKLYFRGTIKWLLLCLPSNYATHLSVNPSVLRPASRRPGEMGTPETSREPCPDRILDDVGGAFGMGAVGGAAFHFLKGTYNSPKGDRLLGGFQAVQMNAPRVGGSFAVWGGLFSTFDCTMVYLRQKEDPWNSIIAGAATGGFLQMRQGLGAASRSAVFGGVLLAMIEGAGIMLNKIMSAPQNLPPMEETVPPNMGGVPPIPMGHLSNQPQVNIDSTPPSSSSSSSPWFGGLFGGRKQQESAPSNGSKTQVLESFDAPNPPSFEYK
ncbi:hypothetical protein L1987_55947 [Smallanthus sonchifolius]|uniref:Uncharacterized protein n=1 Tax=Smallanthus sonchifolius TaxID=185202 RepID=A0ACB9EC36_9ASTR|nr:hypothetical protein L1987_55947 [Smallanthus sonchifolius]